MNGTIRDRADIAATVFAKLMLHLAILAVLVALGLYCYDVATQQGTTTQNEAITAAAIIIGGIVGVILLIKLANRRELGDSPPGFGLTLLGVVGVFLILGATGVEPVARYMGQLGEAMAPWLELAQGALGLGVLVALLNPFILLAVLGSIALIVVIIYIVRRW